MSERLMAVMKDPLQADSRVVQSAAQMVGSMVPMWAVKMVVVMATLMADKTVLMRVEPSVRMSEVLWAAPMVDGWVAPTVALSAMTKVVMKVMMMAER